MFEIYRRGVRHKTQVSVFPPFEQLRFIGRYVHIDSEGAFESVQYALYFPNATYTVDLTTLEEVEEFIVYLNQEIGKAGIKPKVASGTLQAWSGEVIADEEDLPELRA